MASCSFIIPACNEEGYLSACLTSLRQQDRRDFDVVVVDNNSTDGTAEVGAAHGVRVIKCAKQGISAARNVGMQSSTSTWLAFVDADAVLSPRWLSNALSKATAGGFDMVSGLNIFGGRTPHQWALYNSYHAVFYTLFLSLRLAGRPLVVGNNLLVRRDMLSEAGGFPGFVGEDVRLATTLRRQKPRAAFCPAMRITYSPRRFESCGFFRTLLLWIRSTAREIPEHTYTMCHARPQTAECHCGQRP